MVGRQEKAAESAGRANHEDLAELFDRCADFSARAGKASLATELADHARAFRNGDTSKIERIDTLFAWDGPLYRAALIDGWDEEYVGLSAAYRVEAANLER